MDFQVRISEAALAEFEEILLYSWTNFPATAERFGNDVLNHLHLLKSFPYIGIPVDAQPSIRILAHAPILIYYRFSENPSVVEVLLFWHGPRQPPSF